jgi:hypothetical protein
METKLLPTDWIYDNIFHLSEDQYEEYRDLIIEDQKRAFRNKQVSEEGNDPKITGKSYGTPHDLASLYGRSRYEDNSVPDGYDEKVPLGRPEEKSTDRNSQESPFGKDRLGNRGAKFDDNESDSIRPQYKGGSPLALEAKQVYLKNKSLIESLVKSPSLVKKDEEISFLDENNIME